ncbi:MAG TPA: flagellar biosynthetic protein FliR [Desulfitobacteriaceae bacterium]|nr:flagellar biosynthetic protein FliR [Desulfitobacteriaceae bacterium]
MSLAELLQWNLSLFIIILSRLTGMIMLAPVFGARGVPGLIKIGLAGSLTIILYPLILAEKPEIPVEVLPLIGLIIKESLVGLVIGFIIYALTAVLQGAGQLIDLQMGFIMGNILDPVYGMQSPLMGNFQLVLATMLLLATNSHHYLIAAMVKSYTYIPINIASLPTNITFYVNLTTNIFALSVQLAAPVIGAILLADLGIGLLIRVVPQLNIFSVIFPMKILFGFILLILIIPFFGGTITHLFNTCLNWLAQFYLGYKQ